MTFCMNFMIWKINQTPSFTKLLQLFENIFDLCSVIKIPNIFQQQKTFSKLTFKVLDTSLYIFIYLYCNTFFFAVSFHRWGVFIFCLTCSDTIFKGYFCICCNISYLSDYFTLFFIFLLNKPVFTLNWLINRFSILRTCTGTKIKLV